MTDRIAFSDEQALLLEAAQEFARETSPSVRVRALMTSEAGYDAALWRRIADLGWLGLVVPEAEGGSGLTLADAVPIVEALGRHLFASPLLPTLLAASAIAAAPSEGSGALLRRLAGGAIASLALSEPGQDWDFHHPTATAERRGVKLVLAGTKTGVPFAAAAEMILATVRLDGVARLVLLPRDAVPAGALTREVALDETQRTYRLDLAGITLPETALLPAAPGALDALLRGATLLQAAEMCGGVAGVLDVTIEYLKTRKQFGKTIGSYQALKHPTVDIYTQYELLRSLVYGAAAAFGTEEGWRLTRMAKAKAGELFARAGDRAVQFHGGFGFTYDCDAGLYLRRALWSQAQLGDATHHRRHLAQELLG